MTHVLFYLREHALLSSETDCRSAKAVSKWRSSTKIVRAVFLFKLKVTVVSSGEYLFLGYDGGFKISFGEMIVVHAVAKVTQALLIEPLIRLNVEGMHIRCVYVSVLVHH